MPGKELGFWSSGPRFRDMPKVKTQWYKMSKHSKREGKILGNLD